MYGERMIVLKIKELSVKTILLQPWKIKKMIVTYIYVNNTTIFQLDRYWLLLNSLKFSRISKQKFLNKFLNEGTCN